MTARRLAVKELVDANLHETQVMNEHCDSLGIDPDDILEYLALTLQKPEPEPEPEDITTARQRCETALEAYNRLRA
jgi:hypothetical protein